MTYHIYDRRPICLYLPTSKSLMKKKKRQTKQTTMDIFLKRGTPPQDKPQAGGSGGVPEEGVVIVEGDSSVRYCL